VKRVYRLQRPDQFQQVRRKGRTLSLPLVRLNVAPNRHQRTRCGFVVGKKIGNAVKRNRARRRLREAVRLLFHRIARGVDLVFVIRTPEVAEVPFSALLEIVEYLLRRAGVWLETEPDNQAPSPHQSQPGNGP